MGMEKRSRTGTRRTTLVVLDILKTSTSRSNPISELVKRLNADCGIHTHRDSVKDILEDLRAYYPEPDQICCDQSGDSRTYQFNYYYQTELPETLQENIQKLDLIMQKNRSKTTNCSTFCSDDPIRVPRFGMTKTNSWYMVTHRRAYCGSK